MPLKKPHFDLKDYETGTARFDNLMPFKVKDILLISSLYDSYILREDGHLTQLVMSEYAEFNLSNAPSLKRVSTGEEALEQLKQSSFDLIIIFRWLEDIDMAAFSAKAKKITPDIPVVLLTFHAREMEMLRDRGHMMHVDKAFLWSGQINIFLAIIKYIEDLKNVEHDTALVGVRVIIVVEDSVRFYSAYLPLIYSEIMSQTQNLMEEGLNMANRMLRMRARPKILLADSYEEGMALFEKYKQYLLGIISDVNFRRNGVKDPQAGIKFIKEAKKQAEDLPVLLQSSDPENSWQAEQVKAAFLCKDSPTLLADLSSFINNNFGFGNFIFRRRNGDEICRANDFRSMEKCLRNVDEESIEYHAGRNHFSNWLMARTEFDLANRLRPRKVSEFKDINALRQYLIKTFRDFRREKQLGVVTDFTRQLFDAQTEFVRIGSGSLGGKGRGLAFINALLKRYHVYDFFRGVSVSVPTSAIIATDVYDEFIEKNNLLEFGLGDRSDEEIVAAFTAAELPRGVTKDLRAFLGVADYPLAVRSSSLLEDSHYQPFAGIFETHMLPNNHPTRQGRLARLSVAIKLIFASIFFRNSKNYIEATGNRVEEEKMAVIIQKAAGENYNGRFYPVISGIGRSYNFYSIGNIKPEEGIAYAALGLGKTVVEGENCIYFSPSNPKVLPQFSSTKDYLKNSQRDFFAIDMTNPGIFPAPGGDMGLVHVPAKMAEEDGTMAFVGSTYSHENDRIYSGVGRSGVKIITFDPILKAGIYPLDEIIRFLLNMGSSAMNCPVEIEFAANLHPSSSKTKNEFNFLQIRPMAVDVAGGKFVLKDIESERIFCKSSQSLSNGRVDNIRDIVYVRPDNFNRAKMLLMAEQVGKFNDKFKAEKKPYLLIGPGRWGTADHWLGIPVKWRQISEARVLVESVYGDFVVTPSFGTHFFQNIIAFNIGYLTIDHNRRNSQLDWEWLESLPVTDQTEYIRHVRLNKPLDVMIDGRRSRAVVLKPE